MFYDNINILFKVAKLNGILYALDQHAVDERIRLERLSAAILGSSKAASIGISKADGIAVNKLPANLHLEVHASEFRILKEFAEHFEKFGWSYDVSGSSGYEPLVRIRRLINYFSTFKLTLYSLGYIFGRILNADHLRDYIQEISQITGEGYKYVSLPLPKALRDILASQVNVIPNLLIENLLTCGQACRGAIMFGEALTKTKCQQLVDQLALTNNPFICAHGRPTLTPLCDLHKFENTHCHYI